MNREYIIENLINQLNNLAEEKYDFNEETVLIEANITSIGFVKLLIFAESQFDIVFSDEDLLMSNDIKLKDLVDKIINLQNQ